MNTEIIKFDDKIFQDENNIKKYKYIMDLFKKHNFDIHDLENTIIYFKNTEEKEYKDKYV